MLGFTVNTDILMIASGTSDKARDPDRKRACIQLLKWMQITAGARLVLDKTRKIAQEYTSKLSGPCFGNKFLAVMATSDKFEWVDRVAGNDWKAIRIKLRLHDENNSFVRAAMASRDKLLVAEEADFNDRRRDLKKHAEVTVCLAREAVELTKSA